jgi:hypothetical protein
MKTTVNNSAFIDAFHAHDRYDQFGYEALNLLFDYFESVEEDTGEEIELDVIGICCEYAVADAATIARGYAIDIDGMDEDEAEEAVLEYLNENTTVVGTCKDGIVYCTAF